jgi:hypothetical protein
MNNFICFLNSFYKVWNYWIFHDLLSSEIIQSIAFDNYDDFQQVNFIFFTKIHSTILGIILMMKLTLG